MKISIRIMDAYRRFARRYPALFIGINLVFVCLWVSVIMGFSGEDSEVSGGRSARILVGIINVIAPSADVTLENYESLEALQNTEKALRKAAHMFEYGVLAMLVWAVLFGFYDLPRRYAYILPEISSASRTVKLLPVPPSVISTLSALSSARVYHLVRK